MSVGRTSRVFVIATLAVGATMACCGGTVSPPEPLVASPDARATARAQREARRAALDEQGDRPKKSKVEIAAPPPPEPVAVEAPEPEGDEEDEVEEVLDEVETPPVVVEKTPAKLDKNALCISLCDRAVACAREMFGDASGDFGRDMLEPMLSRIAEQCREECQNELDEAELGEAKTCLEARDCEAFMECVQNLKDE